MDAYRCVVTKRDLRTFTDRPVEHETLLQILNAGRMSGSSRNRQPWHFVVVRDRTRLKDLAAYGRFAQHIASAAAAVIVVIDDPAYAFDAGRCAQNMMVAAWSFGIVSCPATLHRASDAKTFLRIPPAKTLAVAISFGHAHPRGRGAVERTALRILAGRGRRPLESMVSWEQFGLSLPPDAPV